MKPINKNHKKDRLKMTIINSYDPTAHLAPQIAAQIEKRDSYGDLTYDESKAANTRVQELFAKHASGDGMSPYDENELKSLLEKIGLYHAVNTLSDFEDTANADLIKLPDATKFLIVKAGSKLGSPAGFHPDTKVFIRPESDVLIATDKLPNHLSDELVYFEV